MANNTTIKSKNVVIMDGEKKFSKHVNMGSSFEDLVATKATVKTDYQLN